MAVGRRNSATGHVQAEVRLTPKAKLILMRAPSVEHKTVSALTQWSLKPSDCGYKIRIVVKVSLEFQKTVVAACIAVRVLAAHMRSRGVHRALALLPVE